MSITELNAAVVTLQTKLKNLRIASELFEFFKWCLKYVVEESTKANNKFENVEVKASDFEKEFSSVIKLINAVLARAS